MKQHYEKNHTIGISWYFEFTLKTCVNSDLPFFFSSYLLDLLQMPWTFTKHPAHIHWQIFDTDKSREML